MMEYVVIGVMVVAAVVAIVLLFGEQLRNGWDAMIRALKGQPKVVTPVSDEDIGGAKAKGKSISTSDQAPE